MSLNETATETMYKQDQIAVGNWCCEREVLGEV